MENWFIRLKEARLNAGKSLKEVSSETELTQQSLIEYEAGRVNPKFNFLVKLCELYGVTLNYIVYGSDSSLNLDLDIQKIIEVLFSLYIHEKILYDQNSHCFAVKDKKIKFYMSYIIKLINDESKTNLKSIETIIKCIKKIY